MYSVELLCVATLLGKDVQNKELAVTSVARKYNNNIIMQYILCKGNQNWW